MGVHLVLHASAASRLWQYARAFVGAVTVAVEHLWHLQLQLQPKLRVWGCLHALLACMRVPVPTHLFVATAVHATYMQG
jgi:hypothetical protein